MKANQRRELFCVLCPLQDSDHCQMCSDVQVFMSGWDAGRVDTIHEIEAVLRDYKNKESLLHKLLTEKIKELRR